MVKGTNWIKGLTLLGMMVAMVGMLAIAPAASANSSVICSSDVIGKISIFAVDAVKGDDVAGATVVVYNTNGEIVLKGTTDANGNFSSYSCTRTYKVKVFADGFKEFAEVVTVSANETTTVKAALQPNSPRIGRR